MVIGLIYDQLRNEEIVNTSADHQMAFQGQVINGLKLYKPIEA